MIRHIGYTVLNETKHLYFHFFACRANSHESQSFEKDERKVFNNSDFLNIWVQKVLQVVIHAQQLQYTLRGLSGK